jgi:hypothetical protein
VLRPEENPGCRSFWSSKRREKIEDEDESDDDEENKNSEPACAGVFAWLMVFFMLILRDLAGPP